MNKSVVVAFAILLLFTGCGKSEEKEVSKAPTGVIDIADENKNDGLGGQEWKEAFVVISENGKEYSFEVDLVTASEIDDEFCVIQYSNLYENDEFRRKLIEQFGAGCKVSRTENLPKTEITKRIEGIERAISNGTSGTEYESADQTSLLQQLDELKEKYKTADDVWENISEYGDGEYYLIKNEEIVGRVAFGDPSIEQGDLEGRKDFFFYEYQDDRFISEYENAKWETCDDRCTVINEILTKLNIDFAVVYEAPEDYWKGREIIYFNSVASAYRKLHYVDADVYRYNDEQVIRRFTLTPLIITGIKEDIRLLNFEETKDAIKQGLQKTDCFKDNSVNRITSMELYLYPVNYEDGGEYVPAWIVNNGRLIVNAIDGTFIDSINPNNK